MKVLLHLVVFLALFHLCLSYEATYKAGIVETFHSGAGSDVDNLANVIRKAGEVGVDILLLPSLSQSSGQKAKFCEASHYDEVMKSLSQAAKEAHTYVVAQLLERVKCRNEYELFENSLLFDRNGGVTPIFRKATSIGHQCNSTTEEMIVFNTDFGVQFTQISASDIVLKNPESFINGAQNFVSSDSWNSEVPFLATQFLSSWSSTIRANLLTGSGIYSGKNVTRIPVDSNTRLIVSTVRKQRSSGNIATAVQPTQVRFIHHEDLSQYIIRPLSLDDCNSGHEETVCHGNFCCHFIIKTIGSNRGDVSSYSLAVFSGVRQYGSSHRIGVQSCAVLACSGLYKRNCIVGSSNETGVVFEAITVKGHFSSENSIQYPTSLTANALPLSSKYFTFEVDTTNQVTVKLERSTNLLTFGIFGREFSKDSSTLDAEAAEVANIKNIYDYVFTEGMEEFVDYVWIRSRVLIFVVSIYVLEMM